MESDILVDEYENVFYKGMELNRGGQGVVYRLSDRNLAVKISLERINPRKLRALRCLPLPPALHITMPLSILKGKNSGYIMKLLDGMVPLKVFRELSRPDDAWIPPAHLAEISREGAWSIVEYAKSGGLRKRLEILSSAAAVMARLHAAGMFYGDISDKNIFYSPSKDDVWWIDPDNISFDRKGHQEKICTPGYFPPEIGRREMGNSCAGDVFSMGVLAHVLLTDLHPFEGELAQNCDGWGGDPTDFSPEEHINRGDYPWIFDESDPSNAIEPLLPPALVLGDSLSRTLGQIFGEGRLKPHRRPTMLRLAHCLCASWLDTVKCSNPACGMSWFSNCGDMGDGGALVCPYCQALIHRYLDVTSYIFTSEGDKKKFFRMVHEMDDEEDLEIPQCVVLPYSPQRYAQTMLKIRISETELKLRVTPEDNGVWSRLQGNNEATVLGIQNSYAIEELNNGIKLLRTGNHTPTVLLEINWKLK